MLPLWLQFTIFGMNIVAAAHCAHVYRTKVKTDSILALCIANVVLAVLWVGVFMGLIG